MRISWKLLVAGICVVLAGGVLASRFLTTTLSLNSAVVRIPSVLEDQRLIPSHLHVTALRREYPFFLARGLPNGGDRFWLDFQEGGGVGLLLYPDAAAREAAYQIGTDGLGDGTRPISDIGERSQFLSNTVGPGLPEIVFMRCSVVVHARLPDVSDSDALAYAQRLDQQLRGIVCG